jgi:hypothetical protein
LMLGLRELLEEARPVVETSGSTGGVERQP